MKRYVSVVLFVLAFTGGCGYGEVSPTTYEYAKSLYSISNRKLADRLDGLSEQIAACCQSGEVTNQEAQWLGEIIESARKEEWQKAMKAARRIMEDQVKR